MLPRLENGVLPPGIHRASWLDVVERFGWNDRRRALLDGLEATLLELARCGGSRAWLDGSFVTEKERPGDFDLVWDTKGVALDVLDETLKDLEPPRQAQREKYGGDILPNVVERGSGMPFLDFFQQDSASGERRGIVELDLEEFR